MNRATRARARAEAKGQAGQTSSSGSEFEEDENQDAANFAAGVPVVMPEMAPKLGHLDKNSLASFERKYKKYVQILEEANGLGAAAIIQGKVSCLTDDVYDILITFRKIIPDGPRISEEELQEWIDTRLAVDAMSVPSLKVALGKIPFNTSSDARILELFGWVDNRLKRMHLQNKYPEKEVCKIMITALQPPAFHEAVNAQLEQQPVMKKTIADLLPFLEGIATKWDAIYPPLRPKNLQRERRRKGDKVPGK